MQRLSWLISIAIAFFGVMIIEHFFAMAPGDVERGGNLGAFGIALVAPFILLSLYITYRFFMTASHNTTQPVYRLGSLLLGILFVSVMYHYANDYKMDVYAQLGGDANNPHSIIYGYPPLNEYTNHIFVNFYTFFFVHGLVAVIAGFIGMFKKAETTPTENQ